MKKTILARAVIGCGILIALAGCHITDAERARSSATWSDKPADITCWTYGERNFEGQSTGKVVYDEGGRLTFVDRANGRLTNVEGDCRVVYAR